MLRLLIFITTACFLSATMLAQAATQENPWLVRMRATYLFWDNHITSYQNTQKNIKVADMFIPELDISYFFTPTLATELAFTYPQKMSVNHDYNDINKTDKVKFLPISLLFQYHFRDLGPYKPYVGIGLNYTTFKDQKLVMQQNEHAVVGVTMKERRHLGFVGQIGSDLMFNKHWGINVDVKYMQINMNLDSSFLVDGQAVPVPFGNVQKAGSLDLSPIMVSAGIIYRF